jgi:VCBS repeat-containing protein
LNGGSLSSSYTLDIQGGALKGSGNITGTVTVGTSGAVEIELGGTTPGTGAGNYDQLNISGSATLSGALKVTVTGGFTPSIGDNFTIMTFASHSGTFATMNLAAPGAGLAWDAVVYNPASVVLNVIVGTNDAPVAPSGGASYSTTKNAELNQAAPGVLGNVTDADGNPLTAILVSNVSYGTLVLNADGSFTYTPSDGFTGTDSFTCKANDGTADSGVFTVTIEVTQGEPPTIASLSKSSGQQGKRLTVVITGTNLFEFTDLGFGEGIKVISIRAESSSRMTADIAIDSDAALGARDVVVTTPEGAFTLEDGFTVEKAKSGGVPVWVWLVVAVAVLAAGAGGFFLFILLPRRKAKRN